MNKMGYVCMVFVLALALAGSAWAMENTSREGQAAADNSSMNSSSDTMKASSEMSSESHSWRAGGIVSAVDPQNHTISIHQETVHHDRTMHWKVDEKATKELSNIKPGDLVNVWGNGKVVTEVHKVS